MQLVSPDDFNASAYGLDFKWITQTEELAGRIKEIDLAQIHEIILQDNGDVIFRAEKVPNFTVKNLYSAIDADPVRTLAGGHFDLVTKDGFLLSFPPKLGLQQENEPLILTAQYDPLWLQAAQKEIRYLDAEGNAIEPVKMAVSKEVVLPGCIRLVELDSGNFSRDDYRFYKRSLQQSNTVQPVPAAVERLNEMNPDGNPLDAFSRFEAMHFLPAAVERLTELNLGGDKLDAFSKFEAMYPVPAVVERLNELNPGKDKLDVFSKMDWNSDNSSNSRAVPKKCCYCDCCDSLIDAIVAYEFKPDLTGIAPQAFAGQSGNFASTMVAPVVKI